VQTLGKFQWPIIKFENRLVSSISCGNRISKSAIKSLLKGAFTLARYRVQFRTKLAHLVIKKIIFVSKTCKLNAKLRAKIANVNAP
jgi:hypothetical protein